MKFSVLLTLLLPLTLQAAAGVGDRAPEVSYDRLLPDQPVANATFAALAGKSVVLEIWATWCGPCVEEIPHLNDLAERFKDRPIVFLSVTDEDPAIVDPFLQKHHIAGLVGIAHSQSPWKAYGVQAVPVTYLIDATGKIAGIAHPAFVTAPILEQLLTGQALTLPKMPSPSAATLKRSDDSGPKPLLDLLIRPSTSKQRQMRTGPGIMGMTNADLVSIISTLYDFPQTRIAGDALKDTAAYDLSYKMPGADPDTFRTLPRDLIAAALGVTVTRETRDADVWILAEPASKPAGLAEPDAAAGCSWSSMPGSLKLTDCAVGGIAAALEAAIGKPVLDETGISGNYDFFLTYSDADPASAVEAMRKLGFKMETAQRPLEFLAVTKTEPRRPAHAGGHP